MKRYFSLLLVLVITLFLSSSAFPYGSSGKKEMSAFGGFGFGLATLTNENSFVTLFGATLENLTETKSALDFGLEYRKSVYKWLQAGLEIAYLTMYKMEFENTDSQTWGINASVLALLVTGKIPVYDQVRIHVGLGASFAPTKVSVTPSGESALSVGGNYLTAAIGASYDLEIADWFVIAPGVKAYLVKFFTYPKIVPRLEVIYRF